MNGRGATDGSTGSTRAKDTSTSGSRVAGLYDLQKVSMVELRITFNELIKSIKNGLQGNNEAFAGFKDVSVQYNRLQFLRKQSLDCCRS